MTNFLQQNGPIFIELGYNLVPIAEGKKCPLFKEWQNAVATPDLIKSDWRNHTGCGVLTALAPAVDIDCHDPDLSDYMTGFVRKLVGYSPSRVGEAPKVLLPYRCVTRFPKQTSREFISADGQRQRLEVLADGQQYVASHIHPKTGGPYVWTYSDGATATTLTTPWLDLPELTLEQAQAIIAEFEAQCERRGWETKGPAKKTPKNAQNGGGGRDSVQNAKFIFHCCPDEERETVCAALFSLSAEDYNLWQRMGHALKAHAGSGAWAEELWLDWSKTSVQFETRQAESKWISFKPKRTDYRSILAEAQNQGWINPRSKQAEHEQLLNELALLPVAEYENKRALIANQLGWRKGVLDHLVETRREAMIPKTSALPWLKPVVLWTEPVDGNQLLIEIYELIGQFVICNEAAQVIATLWTAFTWFIDNVNVAPLAVITAPEKQCGKTQMLGIMAHLVRRPIPCSNISPAAIFRVIERDAPTLLIDEADSFLKDSEITRGILDAGYTRDTAFVLRVEGDDLELRSFNTFGAKAIACIGLLPDTLMDRAAVIRLRRRMKTDRPVKRLRHVDSAVIQPLVQQLARYAEDNGDAIRLARPELPEALSDRAQDSWEPLLAIADLAGGEWSVRARQAALASSERHDRESAAIELLRDIRDVFAQDDQDRFGSDELINMLVIDPEKRWSTYRHDKCINPRQLGQLLGEFGIRSKNIKRYGEVKKGYSRDMFADAFARYIEDLAATRSEPAETIAIEVAEEDESSGDDLFGLDD